MAPTPKRQSPAEGAAPAAGQVTPSSAQILRGICERFQAKGDDIGVRLSLRLVSGFVSGQPDQLGRWLNPGKRTNWRIPLWRIPQVCHDLNASPEERDALMFARIEELAADSEGPPPGELVAAIWAFDRGDRDHGLDQEEQEVLAAFRRVREHYPRGLYLDEGETGYLDSFFAKLLKRAQGLAEEEAGAQAQEDPKEVQRVRLHAEQVAGSVGAGARLLDRLTVTKRRREVSAIRVAQEFLGQLRRRRP